MAINIYRQNLAAAKRTGICHAMPVMPPKWTFGAQKNSKHKNYFCL
jgi:hypothetical protein